ncbi:LacI family DNA-binding transcriptional regulator [Ferrimicrobium sp.]|uniref:LacI family DNA-binding transcriptional regulator n=1 Tax=Ferrimicrobium sp. TaxID=2926050 RepID=UPI002609C27B|nr:LacI family DNA-binding transcriptional regulator [Ferrimicrobium sp.]
MTDTQRTKRATIRDVARVAGVHPSTVSRALGRDGQTIALVNSDTRARILRIAEELNFRPDVAARTLKTGQSHTVGVLLPDLTNPLFPPIVRGLEDRFAEDGFVVLLGNTDDDALRGELVLEGLLSRGVDALVVATARRSGTQFLELSRQGMPIVLINRVFDDQLVPSVATDEVAGIRMAVQHVHALGHRKILHLAGPQDLSTGKNRYRGYLAEMSSLGMQVDDSMVCFANLYSSEEGKRCAEELLGRSHDRPTAIVAANDMLAIGCYQALDAIGLHCPADVAIVGFNDAPFSDLLSPPLTSIRFPHYQVGFQAAQLVLERIANPSAPIKVIFLPPELVIRGSTGLALSS